MKCNCIKIYHISQHVCWIDRSSVRAKLFYLEELMSGVSAGLLINCGFCNEELLDTQEKQDLRVIQKFSNDVIKDLAYYLVAHLINIRMEDGVRINE